MHVAHDREDFASDADWATRHTFGRRQVAGFAAPVNLLNEGGNLLFENLAFRIQGLGCRVWGLRAGIGR